MQCGKENPSEFGSCPECRRKAVDYQSDPARREKKRAYDRDRWDSPEYKEYRTKYVSTARYKVYKKNYDQADRETSEYKLRKKETEERVRHSGRCPSCYRPLMMEEKTKLCRLCNEQGDTNFTWN